MVVVVVAFPIFFGVVCGPVICFPDCTHLLQSAQLRLRRTSYMVDLFKQSSKYICKKCMLTYCYYICAKKVFFMVIKN